MTDKIISRVRHLEGEVTAPSSKAYTHRMVIAAFLSTGASRISNPLVSDDTEATLRAVKAFGAVAKLQRDYWTVTGTKQLKTPKSPVDCGESGATLRFMIPIAALAPGASIFSAGSSLEKRPLVPLLDSLKQLGTYASLEGQEGKHTVNIRGGGIEGGKTAIRGDITSQYISGLLFACPKAKEDTEINIVTPLESRSYLQMTLEVLSQHNIKVQVLGDFTRIQVPSGQVYSSHNHQVPGDFSSAAFLLAAGAITSSKLKVNDLDPNSIQGDRAILDILKDMGTKLKIGNEYVEVEGGQELKAVDVDARNIPDLVPACAALACYAKGASTIYNAKRLRYKESDRLTSLYTQLKKMGAEIGMREDSLTIKGPCAMHGTEIDPSNDHRIAMACAVAALGATGDTVIQDSECVNKSYPIFFDHLRSLGVNVIGR
jgi:3-phosphoshikimate 1-carboxyvinyltransferase